MPLSSNIWALVPVKKLAGAKKRLSDVLSEEERSALSHAMLEDVLGALTRANGLAGTAVVTADEEAVAVARRYGAATIADRASSLNEALTEASKVLATYAAQGVLIVHADLPLASSREVEAIIRHAGPAPSATLVPARADGGSNAMLLMPPNAIELAYGEGSFAKHRTAAHAAGLDVRALDSAGLGLDVDRPDDLEALLADPTPCRTRDYLLASGIAERLERSG
ncbi:MAG: 2-phospho-L-lactate guanylyltransferase [Alphaproteobacteria bacterium]